MFGEEVCAREDLPPRPKPPRSYFEETVKAQKELSEHLRTSLLFCYAVLAIANKIYFQFIAPTHWAAAEMLA